MLEGTGAPREDSALAPKPARVETAQTGRRRTRPWAFALAGAGVAAIATGAALYFGATAPELASRATYNGGVDGYNARVTAGGALLIAGSIASATAAVLFFLHRDGSNNPAPMGVGIQVAGHRGAFGVTVAIQR